MGALVSRGPALGRYVEQVGMRGMDAAPGAGRTGCPRAGDCDYCTLQCARIQPHLHLARHSEAPPFPLIIGALFASLLFQGTVHSGESFLIREHSLSFSRYSPPLDSAVLYRTLCRCPTAYGPSRSNHRRVLYLPQESEHRNTGVLKYRNNGTPEHLPVCIVL